MDNENDTTGEPVFFSQNAVFYVDNGMELTSDCGQERLIQSTQQRINYAEDWLRDNQMVVSPEKSKLLVVSTPELYQARLGDNKTEFL